MPEPVDTPIPTVIIVGAGSAISMSGNIFPLFEQLGIYEELKSVSLPSISIDFYDTKLNALGSVYSNEHNIVTGYCTLVTARPKLYNILRRKVPSHKVSMGKKVLRTKEHDNKVTVYCSDNTEYDCRILVGADGAYSAVRQNIYKTLERQDRLPSIDKEAFSIGYITMVGASKPNNPEKYPQLAEKHRAHFRVTVGDNNDSVITAPDNQISWGIQIQIPEDKAKDLHFRNSEWGPESIDDMLSQFQDFPCTFGGTMKEIFDVIPRNLISKVFLEEKAFQTWYNGQSVSIGDGNAKL
ncbi:hypothetical protein BGX21_010923 [Mortierella sp. AD011]|nr:hypothetical protein BGX21_010923 [Mortierella sp. AD011]